MALKLMYITNSVEIAEIAQKNGVDRIFVDMECIGKNIRQGGLDSVKNSHTVSDVLKLRPILKKSELLVRVNPIHDASFEYPDSEKEINAVIEGGADIIMLPMAKSTDELKRFVSAVGGRAKTMFLLETAQACDNAEKMIAVDGIDEVHIGLNDLHLAKGKKFMFEFLCDGTLERLCNCIGERGIPYGFGGIARLGYGMLPAEYVIAEHYRLKSSMAILSRSFCNADKIDDIHEINSIFHTEINKIREYEKKMESFTPEQFDINKRKAAEKVAAIVESMG